MKKWCTKNLHTAMIVTVKRQYVWENNTKAQYCPPLLIRLLLLHFHDPLTIHTDLSNNTEYPKLKHYKSSLLTWLMNIASSPSVLFSFEGSSLKI